MGVELNDVVELQGLVRRLLAVNALVEGVDHAKNALGMVDGGWWVVVQGVNDV